jgi:hypothetical protein
MDVGSVQESAREMFLKFHTKLTQCGPKIVWDVKPVLPSAKQMLLQ